MSWMQVPFRGETATFIAILVLLVIASLGIGFLISTMSKSDTQAVQLSMLVLLMSIFFSGFFLPLENFILPVRILGYLMPITSSIQALQDVMLRGVPPPLLLWLVLGGLAIVTFLLANVLAARQSAFRCGLMALRVSNPNHGRSQRNESWKWKNKVGAFDWRHPDFRGVCNSVDGRQLCCAAILRRRRFRRDSPTIKSPLSQWIIRAAVCSSVRS